MVWIVFQDPSIDDAPWTLAVGADDVILTDPELCEWRVKFVGRPNYWMGAPVDPRGISLPDPLNRGFSVRYRKVNVCEEPPAEAMFMGPEWVENLAGILWTPDFA